MFELIEDVFYLYKNKIEVMEVKLLLLIHVCLVKKYFESNLLNNEVEEMLHHHFSKLFYIVKD